MKELLKLATLAFFVTTGVVVANRMSAEAMAVVIGVVCGVLASIPMSLVLLMVTRRRSGPEPGTREADYPPVIVVNPGPQPASTSQEPQQYFPLPPTPGRRKFRIIGDEE